MIRIDDISPNSKLFFKLYPLRRVKCQSNTVKNYGLFVRQDLYKYQNSSSRIEKDN